MSYDPLTPFLSWGWEPPYSRVRSGSFASDTPVVSVVSKTGLVAGRRSVKAHKVSRIAAALEGSRLRYAARWECGNKSYDVDLLPAEADGYVMCTVCAECVGPCVYHFLDASGDLLYIGYSHAFGRRKRQHARSSPWWPLVADYRIECFATEEEGRAAEKAAIRSEQPPVNTWGRGKGIHAAKRLHEEGQPEST